jgi:hypothetical protein
MGDLTDRMNAKIDANLAHYPGPSGDAPQPRCMTVADKANLSEAPMIEAATHIEVDAEVRYWEDATVNGVKDSDGSLIPGRDGNLWKVRINLAEGRIEGWPEGTVASIHYKVCDQGIYWLADAAGQRVAKWGGYYVPNSFLCHGDDSNGYGDYIIMKVGADGVIAEYRQPAVDPARWVPVTVAA